MNPALLTAKHFSCRFARHQKARLQVNDQRNQKYQTLGNVSPMIRIAVFKKWQIRRLQLFAMKLFKHFLPVILSSRHQCGQLFIFLSAGFDLLTCQCAGIVDCVSNGICNASYLIVSTDYLLLLKSECMTCRCIVASLARCSISRTTMRMFCESN